MSRKVLLLLCTIVGLSSGCSRFAETHSTPNQDDRLDDILERQDSRTKARYGDRNPAETLRFFGIEPGTMVVEFLPGEGWYSRILAPYLGSEGTLIGVDYPIDLFSHFDWADEEFIENRRSWVDQWPENRDDWGGDEAATLRAYALDKIPSSLDGSVDSVLIIRALHNLARYEDEGGYLTQALQRIHRLLKPGGTVGIVQHRAPADASDDWADGSRGYLKTDFVKSRMREAGFEFVDSSRVNDNPDDQPGENDSVWRLPPSLATSQNDPLLKAQYLAVGESDRMTLLFRKPR